MTPDEVNVASVVVHGSPADIASWRITAAITRVQMSPSGGLTLFFDRPLPDSWKWPSNPDAPSDNFQFTVWLAVRLRDGSIHTAGFVQMWQGREMGKGALPPILTGWPLYWGNQGSATEGVFGDYVPGVGDLLGVMVSAGNARGVTTVTSVRERSNMVTLSLPAGDNGDFGEDGVIANHTDVVRSVKTQVVAAGISILGACGAFEITKRVAWALRGEGAGLLAKPDGNNCQGYAVDIVCYPDGRIFDMLGSSGETNDPAWNEDPPIDPSRYRAAFDPSTPTPQPLPTPGPIQPPTPASPPYDEGQVVPFALDCVALVGQDAGRVGVNCARMQADATGHDGQPPMGYPASRAKHLAELRAEVGK